VPTQEYPTRCGRRCSDSLIDESAATLACRLRGMAPAGSTEDILSRLLVELATGLPPDAAGHLKGIAKSDDGVWAGSIPVPADKGDVHVRRLDVRTGAPGDREAGAEEKAGHLARDRERGEVLIEVVQVVVGSDTGRLELSLSHAMAVVRTELGIELRRE